ncbi:MAG: IS21 family transposase [Streptosporangiaceae bacterium]|nr:IS21 family transposase [Streptosporangiaceae bacterium]
MARRKMDVADIKEILVAWDAGENVSAIARRLGYTRPTVRKYIHAAERVGLARGGERRGEAAWDALTEEAMARVAGQRPPGTQAQEVARHHAYLAERVGTVRLSVLYQRLRAEQGLQVSWGTFYRYVAAQWPGRLARRPRPTIRLVDPPAGQEAQVDFFYAGLWDDPAGGRRRRLYAFLMTLSHSRHQFLYPVLAEDSAAWLDGHVAAFSFFGGAPRRIVLDNLTAGITTPDRYDPRLNRAYGELTRYYGVLVDPARVQKPTDKPRVERNVSYARESFFRGQTYPSLAAWRDAAARWCLEVAGLRVHGSTGEQPLAAFRAREQAALQPLPARPWERAEWLLARVQRDCHVRAGGAWYSVPATAVRRQVAIRLSAKLVEIYDGTQLLATHVRIARGRSTRAEHYPLAGRMFLTQNPAACRQQAAAIGPATTALINALLAESSLTRLREAQAVLRLTERYPAARVEQACARAMAVEDGHVRTVRAILDHGLDEVPDEEPTAAAHTGAFLRGAQAFAPGELA